MTSFVVTLQKGMKGLTAYLSQSEADYKDADQVHDLKLDLATLPKFDTRANAISYGAALDKALRRHPALSKALEAIYTTTQQDPGTLLFEIRVPEAEEARWEGLCDEQQKFPAIDRHCRVGRVAKRSTAMPPTPRTLGGAIRMAAYVSAAGISAKDEVEKIVEAVDKAQKDAGLDLACDLFLGELDLIEAKRDEIAQGKWKNIQVHPIPDNPPALEESIKQTGAHVLHFFCHGVSHTGLQHLEFATINDWDTGEPKGHSLLSLARLASVLRVSNNWLTVLNCCQGAEPLERAHSMAFELVATGRCPAVVGMNEPIECGDANEFADAFYKTLFDTVMAPLRDLKSGETADLDVTPAVVEARIRFYERYKTTPLHAFGRWSLPVLYLAAERIKITRVGRKVEGLEDIQKKGTLIARTLRDLALDAPAAVRMQIHGLLNEPPVVPDEMQPDLFGKFPTQPAAAQDE